MLNNKTHVCLVHYHRKFPVMKEINELSVNSLIKMGKIIFAEYYFPQRICLMLAQILFFFSSNVPGILHIPECHQAISSQNHQSNGQVEVCIKFIMHCKCFDTNKHVYLGLLQIHPTPICPGLPSIVVLIFNRPIRGQMPKLSRPSILYSHDDDHYTMLP